MDRVEAIAGGLVQLGLRKGTLVGLFGQNCPPLNMIELALFRQSYIL